MTTVSAIYDTQTDARAAVQALENAGIAHDDISLVGSQNTETYEKEVAHDAGKGATIGAALGAGGGLLAGLGLLAIPGVGPVVAAGWLTSTAVGAAVGAATGGVTGGLVGALTESGLTEEEAHVYSESVRRGGTVVVVKTNDESQAASARNILQQHHAVDATQRGQAYRQSGWSAFDPNAQPYTPEQIARERNRSNTM